MKEVKKMIAFLLFACIITASFNCGKKEEVPQDCKTCKAYGAGVDQGTVTKQVCTSEDEAAFRSQYTGREISCQ